MHHLTFGPLRIVIDEPQRAGTDVRTAVDITVPGLGGPLTTSISADTLILTELAHAFIDAVHEHLHELARLDEDLGGGTPPSLPPV